MKLHKLKIQNFRKLNNVEILLADATFLIGANNSGKSSTLDAIELLLSGAKLTNDCRSKYIDKETQQEVTDTQHDVIIEGEFREVPLDIIEVHGFNRQRLKTYRDENGNEKYSFNYRIRFGTDNKSYKEMQLHTQTLKPEYADCKTFQELIEHGANADLFEGLDLNRRYTPANIQKEIDNFTDLFDVQDNDEWVDNPGGIPGNVINQLPRFVKIKAASSDDEMGEKSGALYDILDMLFTDVRTQSENYNQAVRYLKLLQREMDPTDQNSEFGKMMRDLNATINGVFPKSQIQVSADLTSADSLKAKYTISLSSNIATPVSCQGTGMIRSAVFGLLRYKKLWEERKERKSRGIIIGFEEPELFLHPNAAENMRNVIYSLSGDSCQIIATTHSPYMIDISQCKTQILNSYSLVENDYSKIIAFNHSDAFRRIEEEDRSRVKMIQKIDDHVARVFFARKALIVEGDTEDIVFKKTISLMPEDIKKQIQSEYQIVKANGKATIISFVKYLKAMNVDIFVVHDEDANTAGAVVMNQPILDALDNDSSKRLMMHNCVEDELGYDAPTSDKPYKAYQYVNSWNSWEEVPENWRNIMRNIFSQYFSK